MLGEGLAQLMDKRNEPWDLPVHTGLSYHAGRRGPAATWGPLKTLQGTRKRVTRK